MEDFIQKVQDFNKLQPSELIDYFAYYLINFNQSSSVRAKDILKCFATLNLPPYSNIPRYLSENSKKVKGKTQKYIKKDSSYVLSRYQSDFISKNVILDAPKVEISKTLRDLSITLQNQSEKEFLEEAIKTFEIEAYQASVIMVWLLTLDHIYEYVLANKLPEFITALRRININTVINSKDDFGDIKEVKFIEACRVAGIISNDVKKILDTKLGIRNSYAHPSTVQLPKSKALEFIEDLVNNVILKY